MPSAQASPSPDAARRRLRGLLAPAVESAGFDLDDVTLSVVGRRTLVRVVVDADGGVDLDGVAGVSHAVTGVIDDDPALAGSYVLEVTSPGVDRPLTEPRHWRRAAGRLVAVAVDGEPRTARVVGTDGGGVQLDIGGQTRQVPWARLGRGKVQVEFNRRRAADAAQEKG